MLASCKKDYTCECKTVETVNGVSTTTSSRTMNSPTKMSKRNALDWCKNSQGASRTSLDYEEVETCELNDKKTLILGIVDVSFATSCKRHRTCVCTSTSTVGGSTNTSTDNYLTPKLSKKDADDWCKAQGHELVQISLDSSSQEDCALK